MASHSPYAGSIWVRLSPSKHQLGFLDNNRWISANCPMNESLKDADELRKLYPKGDEFFTSVGLYKTFHLSNSMHDERLMREIINFIGTVNFYCPKCQRNADFLSRATEQRRENKRAGIPEEENYKKTMRESIVPEGVHTTTFHCSYNLDHQVYFFFLVEKDFEVGIFSITKVGQSVSAADLTDSEAKQYRSVLSQQDYGEFSRAIGLAAHGIGIGAFVYLRRIFERLIEEAHQSALKGLGWNEDEYLKSRMGEKVKLLKSHLPPFLVENWQIYGILSKGIHELSESDCKARFSVVKGGIELILNQKAQAKKEESLRDATQKLAGTLK
jgi:hypothetical protein